MAYFRYAELATSRITSAQAYMRHSCLCGIGTRQVAAIVHASSTGLVVAYVLKHTDSIAKAFTQPFAMTLLMVSDRLILGHLASSSEILSSIMGSFCIIIYFLVDDYTT